MLKQYNRNRNHSLQTPWEHKGQVNKRTIEKTLEVIRSLIQVCSYSVYCRAASIPEANDLSRSSSNASSFASVVEENEVLEEYDTGMVRTCFLTPSQRTHQTHKWKGYAMLQMAPTQKQILQISIWKQVCPSSMTINVVIPGRFRFTFVQAHGSLKYFVPTNNPQQILFTIQWVQTIWRRIQK